MTRFVVEDILEAGKMPIVLGGEHRISFGIAKGFGDNAAKTAVISFGAHLDLCSKYLVSSLSPTTFVHLISKEVKPAIIVEVGTRSVCTEE